ncbi:sphingosine-1-phosphate lyase [Tieghemostelium lacteum]|uniref:sphinganine-1-phosphate aldolase n=1 Tax=Tieghemostelium lacteum TaxID=361077 RepID=A0A151Z3W1_TIELA|nr:sphingosine-1-phosphate lyase [Tieghemostelium lacteum]|eukprot:KYQ88631.1 sphingosine-1-phosphate lyase [Tieghemostelium lacteum]
MMTEYLDNIKDIVLNYYKDNKPTIDNIEHVIVLISILYGLKKLGKITDIKNTVLNSVWRYAKYITPNYYKKVQDEIKTEVEKIILENFPAIDGIQDQYELPKLGLDNESILNRLTLLHQHDINPKEGKLFAYCYPTNEKHEDVVIKAHNMFVHLNALNPLAFQSLRRMEVEVVQMSINMLNGDSNCCGTLTTGGTESLLMALKAYRDMAKDLHNITEPEVVLSITAHPAIEKGAKYFGIKLRYVSLLADQDYKVNLSEFKSKINSNTILLIASAPQYPHGVMDPISDIAALAKKFKKPLHIDACIGGFFLPFLEKLGYPVEKFDFRVPEVTSISADIHKYGYATKGSSVLLFSKESIRKYQFTSYTGWPGGLFVSPSMLGTRSGGNIAAAWASLVSMGEQGLSGYVSKIMKTALSIQKSIKEELSQDIRLIGSPVMSIISCVSVNSSLNIHCVSDVMQSRYGWRLERQHKPNSIHMTLSISHIGIEHKFISNLKECVQEVLENPQKYANQGSAAMYNGIQNIPITKIADEFLLEFLSKTYTQNPTIIQKPDLTLQ